MSGRAEPDDLDRLIDELAAAHPGLRERIEAAVSARMARLCEAASQSQEQRIARDVTRALRSRGLSVRDAAALLGITPAGLKLHDARLQPTRDSSGRRTYDRASVLALARERKSARNQAARSRRGRAS